MIRHALLWASRNPYLQRTLPRLGFVRRAVGRFMPGEDLGAALAAAERLRAMGIGTVLTLLGENLGSAREAEEVVAEYRSLLREAHRRGIPAEISVKLTQLGLDLDESSALEAVLELLAAAREIGSFVWIDMEDSNYRERTLQVFQTVVQHMGGEGIGVCLQAYLRATPDDLRALLPVSPSIRIVKGAYAEPAELAYPRRRDVDEAFFQGAVSVLEGAGRVVLATHDPTLIRRLQRWIHECGIGEGRYEFQMLFGIRQDEQRRLVQEGEPVKVLISYGPAWFPWYMRRLAERPANLWFVIKNLFRG